MSEQVAVGAGNRIAVVDAAGTTQLVDLTTGKPVWTASGPGVPVAGNEQHVLVRRLADKGELTLLSMADGKALWTAPGTGLAGTSVSWQAIVTEKLVVVAGSDSDDLVYTHVYDIATGRELVKRRGRIVGAGANWVGHSAATGAGKRTLNFLTF